MREPTLLIALAISAAAFGQTTQLASIRLALQPDQPNAISFAPIEAKYVRLVIVAGHQCCIDELEIFAEGSKQNLALATNGAKASASSCLAGYAAHQIAHLNDGKYGNGQSWIAAGGAGEWAQIELPKPATIDKVVTSRDREGRYRDRMAEALSVRVSLDGKTWTTVADVNAGTAEKVAAAPTTRPARAARPAPIPAPPPILRAASAIPKAVLWPSTQPSAGEMLRFSFYAESASRRQSAQVILRQAQDMMDRFAARDIDVSREREQFATFATRLTDTTVIDPDQADAIFSEIRLAKRRLMLRDPQLACLEKTVLASRHPYTPSHNYSDIMDSRFRAGGGIGILSMPRRDGRLEPDDAKLSILFDGSKGIARDPSLSFDGKTIYFAYRPMDTKITPYWHLYSMSVEGSVAGGAARQLTDGPYHDYYPCELPDGDLCFVSTRCRSRFLCWVPMSMVLFRMNPAGEMRALSHSNLSEWGPSIMRDGRILWTRSEYQDKGADYGHTLWAARPDGTYPELMFGNNTNINLMNGVQVPDTEEIVATSISHFGDFNGGILLIDPAKGRYNRAAATMLTPDHPQAGTGGNFRDPLPISRDYILVSHRPAFSNQFGVYVIDRYGNRELLYMDVSICSMAPQPVMARPRPPVIASNLPAPTTRPSENKEPGRLAVMDIYAGLEPTVARGTVKYLRVVEEMRSPLETLPNGQLKETYPDFTRYYASPTDQISGPNGWPTYVAKGVVGIAPVEEDGSVHLEAPAGKTLYFQALDADLNEVQRMRSVMQLQEGEVRGCVGCHESRTSTMAPTKIPTALRRPASKLQPPPWGAGPFAYERVVQPVLDAKCISCHSGSADAPAPDLRALQDKNKIPTSYASLIKGAYVHYFNMNWHLGHNLAEPLSFGTVKSKLFDSLKTPTHKDVKLTRDELHAIKCWIDLNVPLWPDYQHVTRRTTETARR